MNDTEFRNSYAGAVAQDARAAAPLNPSVERAAPGSALISPTRAALLIMAVSAILHLLLIYRFPLAPDETYYWQWSRHLDLGYYDQGPLVAWWIRATCLIFGDTPLGVRFGIVLAGLLTILFIWMMTRDLFGDRVALASLPPAILTPFAMAGGFIATYDPLVVLFWSASLYFTARALFFQSKPAWIWLGIALGLGLLSKHTMVMYLPCLLLFIAGSRASRGILRRPEPYLALGIALLVFAPNLWWQAQHDWMTFRHLFLLTGKGLDQSFGRRLGDFVGSQVGLITPILFFLFLAAIVWAGSQGRRHGNGRLWFLFSFSVPILVLFLAMTAKSKVQANWAVCGWLTPPVALALWLDRGAAKGHRTGTNSNNDESTTSRDAGPALLRTRLYLAGISLAVFLCAVLIWPQTRGILHVSVPYRWDQMNKLYGGAELAAAADPVVRRMEVETGQKVGAGALTYDNASRMAFYMAGQPDTRCLYPGTRLNSYVLWNDRTLPETGGSMLLADDYPPDDPRLPPFRMLFQRVECDGKPIQVYRQGVYAEPVHTFYLYRCYGFRPDPQIERPAGG